jgi:hypothetical protein
MGRGSLNDARTGSLAILVAVLAAGFMSAALMSPSGAAALTLSDQQVRDRIEGGWVGGVVGGAWGAPTEFRFNGRIIPARQVPRWSMRQANRYTFATPGGPDETYVEIPFLRALDEDILAGWPEWGRAFRRTRFVLFAENRRARRNLRRGIPAPVSGDPVHNPYASNIGWQIESDFAGLVAPGQPGAAVDIAWRAGHVVGYGDGVYGGVMVAAMHAEAFRAKTLGEIIEAGHRAVPRGSSYRAMIEDVLRWHRRWPGDWKRTWHRLEARWNAHKKAVKRDPRYVHHEFNIDQRLNGAYVLLGLLYGEGGFARTIRISMRAGQDSDCNPSNAASIIGTWRGFDRIPRRFTDRLARHRRFLATRFTLARAIRTTVSIATRITELGGGASGAAGWQIPDSPAVAPIIERWPLKRNRRPRLTAAAASSGLTVAFTAGARDRDGIGGYWWSFGDLSDAAGATQLHTYPHPGRYRVVVWAADRRGWTRTRVVRVNVG